MHNLHKSIQRLWDVGSLLGEDASQIRIAMVCMPWWGESVAVVFPGKVSGQLVCWGHLEGILNESQEKVRHFQLSQVEKKCLWKWWKLNMSHRFPIEVPLKAGGGHGRKCWGYIKDCISLKYQAVFKDKLLEIHQSRHKTNNQFFLLTPSCRTAAPWWQQWGAGDSCQSSRCLPGSRGDNGKWWTAPQHEPTVPPTDLPCLVLCR